MRTQDLYINHIPNFAVIRSTAKQGRADLFANVIANKSTECLKSLYNAITLFSAVARNKSQSYFDTKKNDISFNDMKFFLVNKIGLNEDSAQQLIALCIHTNTSRAGFIEAFSGYHSATGSITELLNLITATLHNDNNGLFNMRDIDIFIYAKQATAHKASIVEMFDSISTYSVYRDFNARISNGDFLTIQEYNDEYPNNNVISDYYKNQLNTAVNHFITMYNNSLLEINNKYDININLIKNYANMPEKLQNKIKTYQQTQINTVNSFKNDLLQSTQYHAVRICLCKDIENFINNPNLIENGVIYLSKNHPYFLFKNNEENLIRTQLNLFDGYSTNKTLPEDEILQCEYTMLIDSIEGMDTVYTVHAKNVPARIGQFVTRNLKDFNVENLFKNTPYATSAITAAKNELTCYLQEYDECIVSKTQEFEKISSNINFSSKNRFFNTYKQQFNFSNLVQHDLYINLLKRGYAADSHQKIDEILSEGKKNLNTKFYNILFSDLQTLLTIMDMKSSDKYHLIITEEDTKVLLSNKLIDKGMKKFTGSYLGRMWMRGLLVIGANNVNILNDDGILTRYILLKNGVINTDFNGFQDGIFYKNGQSYTNDTPVNGITFNEGVITVHNKTLLTPREKMYLLQAGRGDILADTITVTDVKDMVKTYKQGGSQYQFTIHDFKGACYLNPIPSNMFIVRNKNSVQVYMHGQNITNILTSKQIQLIQTTKKSVISLTIQKNIDITVATNYIDVPIHTYTTEKLLSMKLDDYSTNKMVFDLDGKCKLYRGLTTILANEDEEDKSLEVHWHDYCNVVGMSFKKQYNTDLGYDEISLNKTQYNSASIRNFIMSNYNIKLTDTEFGIFLASLCGDQYNRLSPNHVLLLSFTSAEDNSLEFNASIKSLFAPVFDLKIKDYPIIIRAEEGNSTNYLFSDPQQPTEMKTSNNSQEDMLKMGIMCAAIQNKKNIPYEGIKTEDVLPDKGCELYLMYKGTESEFRNKPPTKDAIYKTTNGNYFQIFNGKINEKFKLIDLNKEPDWKNDQLIQYDNIVTLFRGHTPDNGDNNDHNKVYYNEKGSKVTIKFFDNGKLMTTKINMNQLVSMGEKHHLISAGAFPLQKFMIESAVDFNDVIKIDDILSNDLVSFYQNKNHWAIDPKQFINNLIGQIKNKYNIDLDLIENFLLMLSNPEACMKLFENNLMKQIVQKINNMSLANCKNTLKLLMYLGSYFSSNYWTAPTEAANVIKQILSGIKTIPTDIAEVVKKYKTYDSCWALKTDHLKPTVKIKL